MAPAVISEILLRRGVAPADFDGDATSDNVLYRTDGTWIFFPP